MSGQRPLHTPLNDEHLNQIRNAIPHIDRAKAQIELAKRAGINIGDAADKLAKSEDSLTRIRQTYFPGE